MAFPSRHLLPIASLLLMAGACTPHSDVINYVVTSQAPYACCRTIRYSTGTFPNLRGSTLAGEGVVVKLTGDTTAYRCETGAVVGVSIANNGEQDIYIPVSHELEGESIKLYPWHLFYGKTGPIRIARQLQYADLGEREDPLLRFLRLPAGKQIDLRGTIAERWLCAPPIEANAGFLDMELTTSFYTDRTRGLRAYHYQRDPNLPDTLALRYDVVYTTFEYMNQMPVAKQSWNPAHDTTQMLIAVPDEPGKFLDASQKVAQSNVIPIRIAR
jgi:hypothetical protein